MALQKIIQKFFFKQGSKKPSGKNFYKIAFLMQIKIHVWKMFYIHDPVFLLRNAIPFPSLSQIKKKQTPYALDKAAWLIPAWGIVVSLTQMLSLILYHLCDILSFFPVQFITLYCDFFPKL